MGRQIQHKTMLGKGKVVTKSKDEIISVLHQNMQSLNNRRVELDIILKEILDNIEVLCIMEHCMKKDYLEQIQMDKYNLVSYFSRKILPSWWIMYLCEEKYQNKSYKVFRRSLERDRLRNVCNRTSRLWVHDNLHLQVTR